jgi:hypothetical protein
MDFFYLRTNNLYGGRVAALFERKTFPSEEIRNNNLSCRSQMTFESASELPRADGLDHSDRCSIHGWPWNQHVGRHEVTGFDMWNLVGRRDMFTLPKGDNRAARQVYGTRGDG